MVTLLLWRPAGCGLIAELPKICSLFSRVIPRRGKEAIVAGRLPENAPVVTSAANPHYQKHFDRLFGLAKAGDWEAVRDYKVTGSNSYSKMVERYRQDLLALHAAADAAQ